MIPLLNLALATLAFVGLHLILSHPLRKSLARTLGESGFLGFYSFVALITFGWMVWARLAAPPEPFWWIAPQGLWDLGTLVMLFASILLLGSLRGNPAAVDPARQRRMPDRPLGVYAITRHPMMWSFMIWAVVHIILWGSAPNLIVSSGILLLALTGSLGQDVKKRRLMGPDWIEWRRKTAYVPFAGQFAGRIPWGDAWPGAFATLGGIVLWLAATWAHAQTGGPAAGIWRWIG